MASKTQVSTRAAARPPGSGQAAPDRQQRDARGERRLLAAAPAIITPHGARPCLEGVRAADTAYYVDECTSDRRTCVVRARRTGTAVPSTSDLLHAHSTAMVPAAALAPERSLPLYNRIGSASGNSRKILGSLSRPGKPTTDTRRNLCCIATNNLFHYKRAYADTGRSMRSWPLNCYVHHFCTFRIGIACHTW